MVCALAIGVLAGSAPGQAPDRTPGEPGEAALLASAARGELLECTPMSLSFAAGDEPAPQAKEVNTGQDPTRPLTRLDLRLKYIELPRGSDTQLVTLRADKPFALDGGWQLSTRVDLPLMRTNAPSPDNPQGDHEFGIADALIQGLLITPPLDAEKRWVLAGGTQVLFPTGSQDQMGTGKWQLAPTFAFRASLPEISAGSFFAAVIRDQFSFSGDEDRRDINDLVLQPMLHFQLPDTWFITLVPEMRFNLDHSGEAFIPLDIMVGKMLRPGMVGSVQLDVPVVDEYEQYNWQVEFRIGFFF